MTISKDDLASYEAQTRRYFPRASEVQAFRLDEPHTVCHANGYADGLRGDYVVIGEDGHPCLIPAATFEGLYEPDDEAAVLAVAKAARQVTGE